MICPKCKVAVAKCFSSIAVPGMDSCEFNDEMSIKLMIDALHKENTAVTIRLFGGSTWCVDLEGRRPNGSFYSKRFISESMTQAVCDGFVWRFEK